MVKSCEMNGTQSQTKSYCYEVFELEPNQSMRVNLEQNRVKTMLVCKAPVETMLKQDVKYTALSQPRKPVLFQKRRTGFTGLAPLSEGCVFGCDNSTQHLFRIYFFPCFCGIRVLNALCA